MLRVNFDGNPSAKSAAYTQWLRDRRLACAICGAPGDELHHFGPHGMGQKPSDFYQIPVCRDCHAAFHAKFDSDEAFVRDVLKAEREYKALWSIAHTLADFLRECEWSGKPVVDPPKVHQIVLKKRRQKKLDV